MSPGKRIFLKHNRERWHTNFRLIHEKGMFETYSQNFNDVIFHRLIFSYSFLVELLFLTPLNFKTQNMDIRLRLKIHHFDDLELYAN